MNEFCNVKKSDMTPYKHILSFTVYFIITHLFDIYTHYIN